MDRHRVTIAGALILLLGCGLLAGAAEARELSFEERVAAQAAIERVYYAHQIGAIKPFEEAIPRAALERRVRRYLQQSVALAEYWHTPVTAEMLGREIARMVRGTRMPERLRALFAALGDDPLLVRECLARPILVGRLARSFFARDERLHAGMGEEASDWDAWWEDHHGGFDETLARGTALADGRLDLASWAATLADLESGPCPPADTWDNASLDDVPSGRRGHVSVWTGSVMVVWGGLDSPDGQTYGQLNTGGRYDPATDTWVPVSRIGSPAACKAPAAVWTGSEMIVWGGCSGGNTGGRYDPVADAWAPVSVVGQPSARSEHTAVWTGHEMIVWGGHGTTTSNTGGRYTPATDSWAPTATTTAPSARGGHTALWTGTEMLVWGGVGSLGDYLNTGGRYDSASDSWRPIATLGAPDGRTRHSAVWTGGSMIVWGGSRPGDLITGGRYDPVADTWMPTATAGAPFASSHHKAVWTGTAMIVWGPMSGANYDPESNAWTTISTVNQPAPRADHTAVWTGSALIVWGGYDAANGAGLPLNTGGRYDPAGDSWTPTSTAGAPQERYLHTSVWTGNEMIVWGGLGPEAPLLGGTPLGSGARYDPATDAWTPLPMSNAPAPRYVHTAVWTGTTMVVWGGARGMYPDYDLTSTGGRYDPRTDAWTPTSSVGAPWPRSGHTAVWTGEEMIVWGGHLGATYLASGGRYDPVDDVWTPTSPLDAPIARDGHSAVWTGSAMVVWGGKNTPFFPAAQLRTGGRYDPKSDVWAPTSTSGAPHGRSDHAAVWTGSSMVVWGGSCGDPPCGPGGGRYDPSADAWSPMSTSNAAPSGPAAWTGREMIVWSSSGGRYDPVADAWTSVSSVDAPSKRTYHTAVWTGRSLIVWGGRWNSSFDDGGQYFLGDSIDDDADGWSECAGDCNDAEPFTRPGATEMCDGVDQDCNGAADDGDADADGHAICDDCNDADPAVHVSPAEVERLTLGPDKTTLAWDGQASDGVNVIVFDVVRGRISELATDGPISCLASGIPDNTSSDLDTPLPADGYWYLVRARNGCSGTWGSTSAVDDRMAHWCPFSIPMRPVRD